MLPKKRFAKKRLVLDVGTAAIRLCELTKTKTGYQLTRYYQRDLVIDPSTDEATRRSVRAEALKTLLKEAKVRKRRVVMAMPGQSVFTRPRVLPPVPEYRVSQIVRYEIQQQIPFSLDQIALDYQILNRPEGGGYYVLMAAIKVDIVERCLAVLHDVKCSVDIVDVSPLAAYNWLKYTGEFGEHGECVALVDLGAATTDIVIERDNLYRWNRPLTIGGNDITKALAEEFGISFAEAEKLKRERGFAPTGDPQRDGKLGEVIGRVLTRLVAEINRSFTYYRSQPGGGPISRAIIVGGGACLRNVIPYLQRQLGLEVRIAQPLAGLAIGPNAQQVNEHPEQAAVVLGLALRCCEPVAVAINLIPPRIVQMERRKQQMAYWALSFATLLLILGSIFPAKAQRYKAVLENIETLKLYLSRYDPQIRPMLDAGQIEGLRSRYEGEINELKSQVTTYKDRGDAMDKAARERVVWVEYLLAVNDARPIEEGKGIWIASVESTYIGGAPAQPVAGVAQPSAALGGGDTGRRGFGGLLRGFGQAIGLTPQQPGQMGTAYVELPSSGFPGIVPPGPAGPGMIGTAQGTTSGLTPEEEEDEAAYDRRSRARRADAGQAPTISAGLGMKPNGLIVRGYAQDPETVLLFRDRLKESGRFIEGGVYLNEALVNSVDAYALDNADVWGTTGVSGALSTAGYSPQASVDEEYDEYDRRRGSRATWRGATPFRPRPYGQASVVRPVGGPEVIQFRIDLQFSGEKVELGVPG